MLSVVNTPDQSEPVALREVAEPRPAPDEALVAIEAFSLNRGELALMKMRPAGWRPGQDIAGTILEPAADGSGPPAFTRIVGLTEGAGWSERAAVRTDRMAPRSDRVALEQWAVLPIPGLTALRALRRGGLLLGKPVMITGATGIVGEIAIQLAAAAGARVTAIARRDAEAALRALGASEVCETPSAAKGPFDLILESSGGATLAGAIERVAPGGLIVVYGNTSGEPVPFSFPNFRHAQNASIQALFHFTCEPAAAFGPDLATLAALLASGTFRIPVAGVHGWRELPAIAAELRRSRFRGKHVFRPG
jgi:NADPH:quinone reductase